MISFKKKVKKALVSSYFKKLVAAVLVLVVPFTQIIPYPVAYFLSFMIPATAYAQTAFAATAEAVSSGATIKKADAPNDISTVYDLVAVVVDVRLDGDKSIYPGLSDQFTGLSKTTLGARVMRYAEDIVDNNPLTDAKILFYDPGKDSVHDIALALENLYLNGDGTRNNRLAGVVLVGDIPLPVVNKNGNSYASVFPYTDFTEKAYLYERGGGEAHEGDRNVRPGNDNGTWIRNEAVTLPKPEIWHGIIKQPDNTASGLQKLAEYFDKNHLYHEGVAEFAQFDKKLFFADLVSEDAKISADAYKYYLRYLTGLEDLAYMRYNKYWANEITSAQVSDIPADKGSAGSKMLEDLKNGDAMAKTPDIYTKYIIDNALTPYMKLLKQYVAKVNDWAEYTGRYKPADVSSVPVLITMKDEYAKTYLKMVNDALEKKINQFANTMQTPIPLLESSRLSGNVGGAPFSIVLNEANGGYLPPDMYSPDPVDPLGQNNKVSSVLYRFHYKNDVNNKLYINGVDAGILKSPKQCGVYLGSTKNEYFDANKNFNPKANGEYSVMTRAMRSNDVSTAKGAHTVGVNTRLLSPYDTYAATGGAYGATVEDNEVVYGTYSEEQFVSGAIVEDNPDYGISAFAPNPMIGGYKNVLEEKGLKRGDIIASTDYTDSRTKERVYQILSPSVTFDIAIENIYRKAKSTAGEKKKHVGEFTIYFFRGSKPMSLKASFTAIDQSELASKDDDSDTGNGSDGAIFTLYSLRSDEKIRENDSVSGNGYAGQGFDNSAGCNYLNTMFYSDRCVYPVAMMPVLDPAGSTALVKFTDPNGNTSLKFPETFSQNPDQAGDYASHTDMFSYPSDKKFEQIDEVIMNSCYNGLSAYEGDKGDDSNNYDFPLDKDSSHGFPNPAEYALVGILDPNAITGISNDPYGILLRKIGQMVEKGDFQVNVQSQDANTGGKKTEKQKMAGVDPKVPPSQAGDVWSPLKNLTADSIILNTSPRLTLKVFSDRYGIFDGIDNDGDNLLDLADPVSESDPKYGLDSRDMDEVARKLLSKNRTYTIPAVVSPVAGKSIVLYVSANAYAANPSVSSVILHNEPTPYTITEQVKSGTTPSLPIDNPRYVAFQSSPVGDQTVGKIEKIYYPNLFEIPNSAQLVVEIDRIATQISKIPGAEKLGANGQQAVHDKVYQELLATISGNGAVDYPPSGSEITIASAKKIYDALHWLNSNIDEKHKYVLKYYLNPNEDAFINDSSTGYEAAYLVLNGKDSSFNLTFNKDIPEEDDKLFSPLAVALGGDYGGDGVAGGKAEEEEKEGGGQENFFVSLPQFIKELIVFVKGFSSIPNLASTCGAATDMKKYLEEDLSGPLVSNEEKAAQEAANASALSSLRLELSKSTINSNGGEYVTATVKGFDDDGKLVGKNSNGELVTINVNQSENNPVVNVADLATTTLVDGVAVFKLSTGGGNGLAKISAGTLSGKKSNEADIKAISSNVKLVSYVYFEPEGIDELMSGGNGGDGGAGLIGPTTGTDGTVETGLIGPTTVGEETGDGETGAGAGTDATGNDGTGAGATGAGTAGGSGIGNNGSGSGVARGGGGEEAHEETRDVRPSFSNTVDKTDLSEALKSLSESEKKEKQITVLVSELVEKTTLQSTPVEEKEWEETAETAVSWEQEYSIGGYYARFLDAISSEPTSESETLPETPIWEQEYSIDLYYNKYLPDATKQPPEKTSFSSARLLAALASDTVPSPAGEINPFIDAETNPDTRYMIENGDRIVADGKTLMKISAQIYGPDGKSDISSGRKVKFSISESDVPNMVTFVNGPVVESIDGIATIYLRAGTKTGPNDGHFKIRAEVQNGEFPIVEKDLYLVAGDPYSLEIASDSGVLVANNRSKTQIRFVIKDKFENVCKNAFSQIAVFAKEDKAYLDRKADGNTGILGLQLATMDGIGSVDLFAKDSIGDIKIIGLLFDRDLENKLLEAGDKWESIDFSKYIGSSKNIQIVDKVNLKLSLTANSIPLNSSTNLRTELLYRGNVVSSYNGSVKFTNLNEQVINLANKLPQNMTGGILSEANMKLESGSLAGEAEILVEIPGFIADSVKIRVLPGELKKIELSTDASSDFIYTNGADVKLKAALLDEYGNVINTDSTTPIKFDVTDATKNFIKFTGAKTAIALNGVATTTVRGGDVSGKANLSAQDQAGKVKAGILPIKVVAQVTKIDAKDFSPRAMYMSVLGGAFGNPIARDNLAQIFLYDSEARVEAITSVTSTPDENKRLIGVDAYGKITTMAEGIETKAVFATASFPYQKVVVSDGVARKELATIFLAPKNNLPLNLLAGFETPKDEGVYVKQLATDDPVLVFTKKDDGVYVERDGETKAKIDTFGRIALNDDTYEVRLPDEENDSVVSGDFSFVITASQMPLALVTYRQDMGDVKTLPYDSNATSFYPGVYIQLKSPSSKYDLIPSFSGSSTANPRGAYLIDTTLPIDSAQAPGFPQTSLDKAATSSGIGFDGQNKQMLLFASGNSVGESNMPYASDVGITYGDPTVRLKVGDITGMVSQFSGYTKTIGKSIFAGDDTVINLLDFDFNGDGYDDVILLYEGGFVRLLENEDSNGRFSDRGYILNIPGGAFSATKIDVNNDGYDDLIVGTKESCKANEKCLSLFMNIDGHLERQTLNLALDGRAYEMKVVDANGDGCDDLFVSDSAGNIRLFYNQNDGKSCRGLATNYGFSKNFGFSIDGGKNTAESLFIYYSGAEQLYRSLVLDKSKQAAQVDIATLAGMDMKVRLENEAQENASKFLKFTLQSGEPPGQAKNDQDPNFDPAKNTDPNFDASKYAKDATEFQQMAQSNPEIHDKVIPPQTFPKEYNFIQITEDPAFVATTKLAIDVNGQFANVGDEIQYDVTLKNNGGGNITELMLSDGTPAAVELIKDSLKCMDANCPDKLTTESWVDTGVQLRSHVIKGISVPAHGSRKIQYKFKLNSVPKVHFNVGNDLGEYPDHKNDSYLDILVRPEFKADKSILMTHFYSTGVDASNHVIYEKMEVGPATDKNKLIADQFDKSGFSLNGLLSAAANTPNGPPPKPDYYLGSQQDWEMKWWSDPKNQQKIDPKLTESLTKQISNMAEDSNFDGVPNSWDGVASAIKAAAGGGASAGAQGQGQGQGQGAGGVAGGSSFSDSLSEFNDMADSVANGVQGALNSLRCSGAGCLPIPFNYAFLVPDSATPGTAIVAWGVPSTPPVMTMWPSMAPSSGRFYISPTLDGGLVIGLCIGPGPGHASPCWAFAVPLGALGVCPDFMGAISDAVGSAKNAVNSATGGAMAISSDGSDPSAAQAAQDTDTVRGGSAYSSPGSPIQAGASANIRIPGFPAVITDWFDRQIQEVFNKLLDLSDIYFIYPDFASLGPQFKSASQNFKNMKGGWNSVHDFLKAVNSLPLVTIEGREVIIKIPTVPSNQIAKYKFQAQEWLKYEKNQLERLKTYECDTDANSYCQKFKADLSGFIKSVESMLDTLDRISNLPYEIMKWRTWEQRYATQIICYLDSIMIMIGGYIKKQMKIIQAWMQMIEEIIRIFKSWKMILDLIVDFQTSCDECKNDRFSKLGLLMQLFVAIPSPPIIPMPKWPDLVFDISQLQLGIKILWPDVVFKPEPIYLPDLPLITVPVVPDINIEFPSWTFDIGNLPSLPEMPDLPPLPIPKLPDLPRPPKIPALPDVVVSLIQVLKPILKILCLLKKGFMPVMESSMATEVETLTQPNLDVVLMLLGSMSVQLPAISYDYVKEIRITAVINVAINVEPIYNVVKRAADELNNFLKNIIGEINGASKFPIQQIIDEAVKKMTEEAAKAAQEAVDSTFGIMDEIPAGALEGGGPAALFAPTDTAEIAKVGMADADEAARAKMKDGQNTLLDYAPAVSIKENTEKFAKTIEDFVNTMPKDDSPSVYYLTATQTYLDKNSPVLNRSLADVKRGIADQDLPDTPEMRRLVELRDSLIAYTENLEKSNYELLQNVGDTEKFGKILADNNQSPKLKKIAQLSVPTWFDENANSYFASNSADGNDSAGGDSGSYAKMPFFDKTVTDQLFSEAMTAGGTFIAANTSPQLEAAKTNNSSGSAVAPKGLFVIIDDKNENILNYTSELGGKTNMLFMDADHDGDEDMVYSLGGDVYMKENYKNEDNPPDGKVLSLYGNNAVEDYAEGSKNSIQGVFALDNNESADINWLPSGSPETVAYEVVLRNSIYDEADDAVYRYIALVNKANTPESADILGKLGIDPPEENEENPKVFELENKDSPSLSVKVANGNYYATVTALDKDLNVSLQSAPAITSPQECADKESPFPAIDTSYDVPVMKEFELDAGNSFDSNGKIVEYSVETLPYSNGGKKTTKIPDVLWSDTNVIYDSNGDGMLWNDRDNPKFKIGPFVNEGDVGKHEFILHVVDQSGNSSEQRFTLNVFVPKITLDGTLSRNPVVTGKTDPNIDKMPFSLMRKRFIYRVSDGLLTLVPKVEKVQTPSISQDNKYYTNPEGAYVVSDLNTEDIVTVKNQDGDIVAEINPLTGNVNAYGHLKSDYYVVANEAVPPLTPTGVKIVDEKGNVYGSVYTVSDANTDVTVYQNYEFEKNDFASLSGTHVSDTDKGDDFVIKKFPASDPHYPGGAGIVYVRENKYLAFIDTSGNILLADPRVKLTKKKNNHLTDPLIFEIRFNMTSEPHISGIVVAEVYVSSLRKSETGIVVGPKNVPYQTSSPPSNQNLYGPAFTKGEQIPDDSGFIGPLPVGVDSKNITAEDIDSMLDDLYRRGIIDDLLKNEHFKLTLDGEVTRAEFVTVLLNMLCIIPRKPEAYTTFKASEGFSDMRYEEGEMPWFFPYIREASMPDRGLIDGYRGKTDIDPLTGLPPFRPDNGITRAEAAKIILDALAMRGIIDGEKITGAGADGDAGGGPTSGTGAPWYEPYIAASKDLSSYLKSGVRVKNTFILTPEEAQFPNEKITFRDLLLMTLRVIDLYDCYAVDADKDGMSDFWEQKNGVGDPNADLDNDGLTNFQESRFGSNPMDPDTDHGGANDGQEYKWETNPMDPVDDPVDSDGDGLTDRAEALVYQTDFKNPDTDGDCINDGQEASNLTNPLDPEDPPADENSSCNGEPGQQKEGVKGIYIVPAECNTCPCISTFDHKADIVPTDIFFSTISNFEEDYFFSKSDEVTIETVQKQQ